jgi:aldose 1-epimerase
MRAPTGEQFEIARSSLDGQTRAIITEVAAGLRALSVDGVELVETFAENLRPPLVSGVVLVPWPNRVEDGIWMLDGVQQHLALTEPGRHNAVHGLLASTPYRVAERSDEAITLAATVFPQAGFPFHLDTTVRYEVLADGLRVTHGVRNVGGRRAPYAVGAHPYFRLGDVPTEDLVLTIDAATRFETDARLNPLRVLPVEDSEYDLRQGRRIGDLVLDDAFGSLAPVDGISRHSLTAPDGRFVELWQDEAFGFVQVFTTDRFPRESGPVHAVAVEPMTAPPNALNSGLGLIWLEPGESWSGGWGVRTGGVTR